MSKRKHSRWDYIKHALMHPWHVVVLAGATVFGVANWSVWVMLIIFAIAELVLLGVVYHLKAFRDYVDERYETIARAKARGKRNDLLNQMDVENRKQIARLEELIDGLRQRLSAFPSIPIDAVGECRELLGQYMRQSIQRQMLFQGYNGSNLVELENQIRSMETMEKLNPSDLTKQRLAIALKRHEAIIRMSKGLVEADYQLATLAELIALKVEQALIPTLRVASTINMSSNDLLTPDADEYAQVEDIDMEMMEMGRAG